MWIQMREPFSSDRGADIADPLARYYLMRYHFQIKLNTNEDDGGGWPRGRCRSWRRSTGTAPSSSGWGRPDSRARGDSPSARGASRWSSRWAAPARTASRSRGGTGPDKSAGESQLWKPETGDCKHVVVMLWGKYDAWMKRKLGRMNRIVWLLNVEKNVREQYDAEGITREMVLLYKCLFIDWGLPTLPPILAASYQTRTERCRPHSRWGWTSTPGSCRSRGSGVNLSGIVNISYEGESGRRKRTTYFVNRNVFRSKNWHVVGVNFITVFMN